MGEHNQIRPRKQTVQDVLANGRAQTVGDLPVRFSYCHRLETDTAHLQGIEDDI
jgi:hypothetical protein